MITRRAFPGIVACLMLAPQRDLAAQAADSLVLGPAPGAFLALSVASMDRMRPWYRDTLGFQVYREGEVTDRRIRFALLRQGSALVELLQLPDARPRQLAAPGTTDAHQRHGFFKSGFVVADIDRVYRLLVSRGVRLQYDLGRPDGPYRSFGILDPEGNLLQFFGT